MKTLILVGVIALVASQCGPKTVTTELENVTLVIRSGTSYGFCIGYCERVLELKGTAVTYTMRDIRQQLPDKVCNATISASEWNNLAAKADLTALQKQPERLGCPDCADGGAEFLEIQQGDQKYRVTFEANKTIPGFDELVVALRQKREALKDCR